MSEENGRKDQAEALPAENGGVMVEMKVAEVEGAEAAAPAEETEPGRKSDSKRLRLPVLPLRGTVVFPAVAAPIAAGRDKTMKAIDRAIAGEKLLFAVAQLDAEIERPDPEHLYRIGTVCRIAQMQKVPGGIQMVIQGDTRAAALEYAERDGYLEVVAREMDDMDPLDPEERAFAALYKEVHERSAEVSRLRGVPKEIVDHLLGGVSTPGELADLVAFYTELEVEEKQELLETLSVEARLRSLLVHLQKQIGLLEAQEEIREQVQEELGERQREIFLREQMKAIQKELGEDIDSQEANDLRERIEALELPEEARQEVDRELRRLERIPRESAEAQVVRTYLEIVADLPWSETTEEQLDIPRAEEVLERDHYGLQDVKDRVLDFLAVRKLQEETRLREARELEAESGSEAADDAEPDGDVEASGDAESGASGNGDAEGEADGTASDGGESDEAEADPVPGYEDDRAGETLLFVGPPGVGKTSIARSIADAMGRKYVRVSLGGARDEADIRGHRRTYVGAMAGRIIEGLKRAGTKNPVFLLDEIDKLGVSFQGDPSAALMEVLDPAQNEAFVDHYLGVPFDLSEVLFIATANVFEQIPGPLRDRMEAIEFRGYTEAEKLEIARRFLLPRQKRRNGLLPEQVEVDEGAIRAIITRYTREAGVRQLERELGSVCRKSARKIATGSSEATVDADDLRELLGRPKVHAAEKMEEDAVGVATGMFYTPVGGDIMLVETRVLKGKEGLVLTGQLGDVMKESAQAALTFARSHANGLDLTEERLRDHEIHIHVPAGAIPKEGPSAGIAMAVALVSALGDHPVRHDVAMTGEITLSGRVLPIGGVKEKVLGAARAGINEIILPAINEGDLEDLPDHVCEQLEFHLVETLDEALAAALANGSLEGGALAFAE
ncbi:endopeptidase La [Candidatus Palauibacter polyketidifaciens]|uniref:endopeptidase La n=1 Tax=Candidatus Palauibacter polyketidifaciens TaxID=3056740 RepID=UPI002391FB36|nr:endopeptidase La [Candidatus Palauibacter polyketidifaciens]MDE2720286.1 endopeptidase La [Candidatus Palauibacter polyketidifaciens]